MSLLIRNARILTLAPSTGSGQANSTRPRRGKELADLGIIPAGEVLVADGKIAVEALRRTATHRRRSAAHATSAGGSKEGTHALTVVDAVEIESAAQKKSQSLESQV